MRGDGAAVGDKGCDKADGTPGAGGDDAVVLDGGIGAARAGEAMVACHEVTVIQIGGGGDETADINTGILADDDAVLIDEHDVAVGGELAQEGGSVWPGDAVEGNAVGAGLDEADFFASANVELLPVNDGLVRSLIDEDLAGGSGDAGLAGGDSAALGVSQARGSPKEGSTE